MEKYSVLMTVYKNDNPEYFELSLDSMINQTIKPDEIVIVKDGPITENLQKVIDKRLKYNIINQIQLKENVGLGLALNEGIEKCRNSLIARMDSDDFSMPNRCELQLKEFEKNPQLDIVGCPVDEFVDDINNIIGCRDVPKKNKEIYKYAKKRDPFNHPTVMYKKSMLEKVGLYSNLRKNQDTDLWIRFLKNNAICMNISEHVFRFRFDDKTYEKRKSWVNTKILIGIRYKSWKDGFNSFWDFFCVFFIQFCIFIMPIRFQKIIYKKVLRK